MICLLPFYVELLNTCTIPRLRHAFLTTMSTTHVSPFLRAHPQIKDLQCITVESDHDFAPELRMPSLTHFTGYSSLLKLIARPKPPIEEATVMWNIEVEDAAEVERVFGALGRCKTVTTLVSMSRGINRILVEAMAKHVPWVHTLFLHNLVQPGDTDDYLGTDVSQFWWLQSRLMRCLLFDKFIGYGGACRVSIPIQESCMHGASMRLTG